MKTNQQLLLDAQRYIPGGVNSPVRSFRSVGIDPKITVKANGAFLFDVEGKRYIDYVGSWGASILGHAYPDVITAVKDAADKGLSFGATSPAEIDIAQKITELMPSIEKVRLVNSGTEATMTAIRLSRGFTKRSLIVKFEGCYHGHVDSLLVKAGSGALTFGQPDSAGIPDSLAQQTCVLSYNDTEAVNQLFDQSGTEIAAVIVEPVAGNMNLIMPEDGFLQTLQKRCKDAGALLIFDEVMTGFRVGLQGAQGLFNIQPDLTTLGKVIGGGLPVGAIGGRADIMDYLAPTGPVYQAGTLSGNPLTVAAGLAALQKVSEPGFYDHLNEQGKRLTEGLTKAAKETGIPFSMQHVGGMFGFYFSDSVPKNCEQSKKMDVSLFNQFFTEMLSRGVYLAPSAFEAGFLSLAHNSVIIDETIDIARDIFLRL